VDVYHGCIGRYEDCVLRHSWRDSLTCKSYLSAVHLEVAHELLRNCLHTEPKYILLISLQAVVECCAQYRIVHCGVDRTRVELGRRWDIRSGIRPIRRVLLALAMFKNYFLAEPGCSIPREVEVDVAAAWSNRTPTSRESQCMPLTLRATTVATNGKSNL
jgi:hypothetical protein